jgi:hypothetical protein
LCSLPELDSRRPVGGVLPPCGETVRLGSFCRLLSSRREADEPELAALLRVEEIELDELCFPTCATRPRLVQSVRLLRAARDERRALPADAWRAALLLLLGDDFERVGEEAFVQLLVSLGSPRPRPEQGAQPPRPHRDHTGRAFSGSYSRGDMLICRGFA